MKRRSHMALACSAVVAAMLATFAVVGAQPAAAQLPTVCHGAPYVYNNVTVYNVHTAHIDCHSAYGHTDVLVDQHNQGLSPHLTGFSCAYQQGTPSTRSHAQCTNLEHRDNQFEVSWLSHPPAVCPAVASTPATSIFTRTRGV
jgi:hypothetical protein